MLIIFTKLHSKKSEMHIGFAVQFMLFVMALVTIISAVGLGITAVKIDALTDELVEEISGSSLAKSSEIDNMIAEWADTYDAVVTVSADEWDNKSNGRIAYGATFAVTVEYSVSFLKLRVTSSKYGVARHAWR